VSRSSAATYAAGSSLSTGPADTSRLVQVHGVVLAVRVHDMRVLQASAHAGNWLGRPLDTLLLGHVSQLGGDLAQRVRQAWDAPVTPGVPKVATCTVGTPHAPREVEAWVHPVGPELLVVDVLDSPAGAEPATHSRPALLSLLEDTIHTLSQASEIGELAAQAATAVQRLCGHEEVRLVRFEPESGPHVVLARRDPAAPEQPWPEDLLAAADASLASPDGLDVLADTWPEPVPLLPHLLSGATDADAAAEVVARSTLRSPAPARLARLRAAGVRAEANAWLVRDGRPWGVISCLDSRAARPLAATSRIALALIAEAVATRITALESVTRAEVAEHVRRLQTALVEAATQDGDWRAALARAPHLLLQPLQATGVALRHQSDGVACGRVPEEGELQAVIGVIAQGQLPSVWHSDDLAADQPELASVVPPGTRLLAVRLSVRQPEYLLWWRHPAGPDEPASAPWHATDLACAAALGEMLVDLMVQFDAVRLLIAGRQLESLQAKVADSREAVVVCDAQGRVTLANAAFATLTGRPHSTWPSLDELVLLFTPAAVARRLAAQVRAEQRAARSVLSLWRPDGTVVPVAVRAEPVLARSGGLLGVILLVEDLTAARVAEAAWSQLQGLLGTAATEGQAHEVDPVVSAIRTHASLAAMDMADTLRTHGLTPLLRELESSTQRSIALAQQLGSTLR
jgi:PAS domain S-box-containing protein